MKTTWKDAEGRTIQKAYQGTVRVPGKMGSIDTINLRSDPYWTRRGAERWIEKQKERWAQRPDAQFNVREFDVVRAGW